MLVCIENLQVCTVICFNGIGTFDYKIFIAKTWQYRVSRIYQPTKFGGRDQDVLMFLSNWSLLIIKY